MKKTILFICLFALIGCRNKDNEEYEEVDFEKQEYIELAKQEYLEQAKQDIERNSVLYGFLVNDLMKLHNKRLNEIEISDLYFEEQLKLMNDYLTAEAYERLPPDAFRKRLNEVFGRFSLAQDIDIVPIVIPTKREIGCDEYREALYITDEDMRGNYYNASIKYGFITPIYHLSDLIDYRVEFPSLALIEDAIKDMTIECSGSENYDEHGKYRDEIFKKLKHRNLYLFHNDKNSFNWLTTYDSIFLEQLVLDFGYVSDKDLLKWVIDNVQFNVNEFDNESFEKQMLYYMHLLSFEDSNGNLIFHQETIDALTSYNQTQHYNDLKIFIINMGGVDALSHYVYGEDRMRLYTILIEMMRKMMNDSDECVLDVWFYTRVDGFLYDLEEEFVKNNYFNSKGLKEFWEKVKEQDRNYVHDPR